MWRCSVNESAPPVNNVELISFATADELARAVAGAWLDEIAAAQRAGKAHCVALSGGRITLKFFAAVIEMAGARGVSLADVHFFWADERCVPPADPESNFAAANEQFFQPLAIAPEKVHRIQGELPPDQAADLATAEIQRVVLPSPSPRPSGERVGERGFELETVGLLSPALSSLGGGEGVGQQPSLDLIFLGMGEDGHVASLFPGEPETARANPAVFRAITNSPKPPPNRVTLGYAAIAAAKHVWVLASGKGKEAALAESLSPTGQPRTLSGLARVLQSRPHSKVFTDIR